MRLLLSNSNDVISPTIIQSSISLHSRIAVFLLAISVCSTIRDAKILKLICRLSKLGYSQYFPGCYVFVYMMLTLVVTSTNGSVPMCKTNRGSSSIRTLILHIFIGQSALFRVKCNQNKVSYI
ncbi:hypothetical protein V1524DRAFT_426997 [Lipomyces starkeyi]